MDWDNIYYTREACRYSLRRIHIHYQGCITCAKPDYNRTNSLYQAYIVVRL